MDDAFRMVAARMPRTRRFTPFAARATALLVVIGLLLFSFAVFVVSAQQKADARRAQLAATQRAEAAAEAQAAAEIETLDASAPDAVAVGNMLDAHAQAAATAALDAARTVASTGSIADAAPNALTALDPTDRSVGGQRLRRRRRMGRCGAGSEAHLLLDRGRGRRSHPVRHGLAVHRDGGARGRPARLVVRSSGPRRTTLDRRS
jgi:hypothetical protein